MNTRTLVAALALVTLSGCGGWVRPGASEADFNRDNYACQGEVMARYPVVMVQTQVRPGYDQSTRTTCTGYGNSIDCQTTGGYVPPVTSSEDANAWNRIGAQASCMKSRGWTWATK